MKRFALALATISVAALASVALPPRFYDVTTETGMPHLEENLRYSITHDRRCLARDQLAVAFPVLNHASLQGCRLEEESEQEDAISYRLMCDGGHGTTGTAIWELGEHRITGTLRVKLGGKNMTFYQRITAIPVGQCEATTQ